jgi:hypothetical protein
MGLYERPHYYMLIHIVTGLLGAWYPIILIIGLMYQFIQYILNLRVFIFDWKVKEGNSLEHTGLKILEIMIGYVAGLIVFRTLRYPDLLY